jgi:hypothetical protein
MHSIARPCRERSSQSKEYSIQSDHETIEVTARVISSVPGPMQKGIARGHLWGAEGDLTPAATFHSSRTPSIVPKDLHQGLVSR